MHSWKSYKRQGPISEIQNAKNKEVFYTSKKLEIVEFAEVNGNRKVG